MSAKVRPPLEEILTRAYPYEVTADPDGGYVITFPDLPGCMTQVESSSDVGPMADEIRTLWIETAYEMGQEIPLPSQREEYSGKLNVRLPRSLHRILARAAEQDGLSLNSHICLLLARNDALHRVEQRFDAMEARLEGMEAHLRYPVTGVPTQSGQQEQFRIVNDDYEVVAA